MLIREELSIVGVYFHSHLREVDVTNARELHHLAIWPSSH